MASPLAEALCPRKSGRYIADNAEHVKIMQHGVEATAKLIIDAISDVSDVHPGVGYRAHALHPQTANEAAVDWVFFVTTLNFNFWWPAGAATYAVRHDGVLYSGYFAVCAAINRAISEGLPVTDPRFYSQLDLATLKNLLRSDTEAEIPLMEERLQAVTSAGKVLVDQFGGSFVTCVRQCAGSAQRLLRLVIEHFQSFRDEAVFKGQAVSLYKRAQILIADLWLCFDGDGLGHFADITSLTMFADYRVPQTLAYLGALEYSARLTELLRAGHVFSSGDQMEVEIRGCSIEAVERIVAAVRQMAGRPLSDTRLNSIVVDNFVWGYRRDHVKQTDAVPFHRVRCIYY